MTHRALLLTTAAVALSACGADVGSSGDIVSVASGGTFATIVDLDVGPGEEPVEYLARIDPTNGRATEVARTSVAWWGAAVTTIAPVAPP
jgi:hypothetical protein